MKVGLLALGRWYASAALLLSFDGEVSAADVSSLKVPSYNCPYGLEPIDCGEAVFVDLRFLHILEKRGIDLSNDLIGPLRQRFNKVIGLDETDAFALSLRNETLELLDSLLKVNGLYCDYDLYNFVSGALDPEMKWTAKHIARERPFDLVNLEKLYLWAPCFITVSPHFKHRVRQLYGLSPTQQLRGKLGDGLVAFAPPINKRKPPRNTVHFFGSLTNIQRATAVELLNRSTIQWIGGITGMCSEIAGLSKTGIIHLNQVRQDALMVRLQKEGLLVPPLGRIKYHTTLIDCKAVLSITGHGEICYRMAEAWSARRVLVCQDLSHAKTLFPFESGKNVVYCRPDLSDLIDILDDIECNFQNYIDIAEQGYHDWIYWSKDIFTILEQRIQSLIK